MTVAELIAKLQDMPQDIEVELHPSEGDGDSEIRFVQLIPYVTGDQVYIGYADMQDTIDALNSPEGKRRRG